LPSAYVLETQRRRQDRLRHHAFAATVELEV
jgi:hypothetical protein